MAILIFKTRGQSSRPCRACGPNRAPRRGRAQRLRRRRVRVQPAARCGDELWRRGNRCVTRSCPPNHAPARHPWQTARAVVPGECTALPATCPCPDPKSTSISLSPAMARTVGPRTRFSGSDGASRRLWVCHAAEFLTGNVKIQRCRERLLPALHQQGSARAVCLAVLNEIPGDDIDEFVGQTLTVRRDPGPRFHCCQNNGARVLGIPNKNSDCDASEARRNWIFILGNKESDRTFSAQRDVGRAFGQLFAEAALIEFGNERLFELVALVQERDAETQSRCRRRSRRSPPTS